jgi:hypothetical protein
LGSVFYGLASKALPTIGGIIGGGIGMALGATTTAASLGTGVFTVPLFTGFGAMTGNVLGHSLNSLVYSAFPSSWKDRIEEKINESPDHINGGQWVGFGADLALGGFGANKIGSWSHAGCLQDF